MKREEAIIGKRVVSNLAGSRHTSGTIANNNDWLPSTFAIIWDDEPNWCCYYANFLLKNIHEHP
jgi:hypothetical protein